MDFTVGLDLLTFYQIAGLQYFTFRLGYEKAYLWILVWVLLF